MRLYFLLFLAWTAYAVRAEGPATALKSRVVSGYIKDAQTGEVLIGATIGIPKSGTGTVSNHYGYYSLSLPEGRHSLQFTFLGYESVEKDLDLSTDKNLNVELAPASATLNEVKVVANQSHSRLDEPLTGVQKISGATIKQVPLLLGEADALKALQLMPGVRAVSEGSSGFSVRGGNPDQNLILLDEAPVYNAGHLLGFFSVFNNDAIKDVSLYKGDIPAKNGGRLASVLDIRMKDGNARNFTASGGVGTISSRLTLEGPIASEKTTFLLAGRRTYADLFLKMSSDEQIKDNILYFYDVNAKLSHSFSESDRIYFSAYLGKDVVKNHFSEIYFGNHTSTFRWNHVFSPRLFSNLTLLFSNYQYGLAQSDANASGIKWISNMQDYGARLDFNYYPTPAHSISFGAQSTLHDILPGEVRPSDNSVFSPVIMQRKQALEHGFYIENAQKIGTKLTWRYGLRLSVFQNYDLDAKKSEHSYWRLEPRSGLTWMFHPKSSFKASYARTYQYMHLSSNSQSTTPLDVWFLSSPVVKPQRSDQFSLGWFRHMANNSVDLSIETFYKDMQNTIDFKDYADLMLNEDLESELRFGRAYAYGLEFMTRYNRGKWTGWLSYTWSRSRRKVNEINNNEWYYSPYDLTHDVSIVASYRLSPRLLLSGNWVFTTGAPVTFPVGRFESGNDLIPIYSERNAERMPDYHRLDVGITWKGKENPQKKWQGEWVFSAYNAYARKNAWSIYFEQDENNPHRTKAMKSYLFSIIPAITYNFRF